MLNQSFIAMSASFAMVFMFRAVPNSSGRDFQFGTVHAAAVMHIYLAGFNASVRALLQDAISALDKYCTPPIAQTPRGGASKS
jgi:hypothetical protein